MLNKHWQDAESLLSKEDNHMPDPYKELPETFKKIVEETLDRADAPDHKVDGAYWMLSTDHCMAWARHILRYCGCEHTKAKANSVLEGNLMPALGFDIAGYPVVQAGGVVTTFAVHTII